MGSMSAHFSHTLYIRATAPQVFDAITRPEVSARYWGENVSDWTPGSGWEHVRVDGGRRVELVGEVVENSGPERLVLTWANASDAGDPAKSSRVTFELVPYEGMVRLTVDHEGLEPGGGMDVGIRKGWPLVLSSLKSLLETGEALDIFAEPTGSAQAA